MAWLGCTFVYMAQAKANRCRAYLTCFVRMVLLLLTLFC